MNDSYLVNCLAVHRQGDPPMFTAQDGKVIASLEGYAIIPIEEYHRLYGAVGSVPEDHWPCASCGASGPTPEGHDPCIANLPGVRFACCGHGYGHANIVLENGVKMFGHFDHVRAIAPATGAEEAPHE